MKAKENTIGIFNGLDESIDNIKFKSRHCY